ncbi:MAG TPA: cation:proton antiporter [Candidatus Binataceae bacterium]|nr:cation:proton antiporter [Candidatus Binataceae bacterium]
MNSRNARLAVFYALMLGGAVVLYLLVRSFGDTLVPDQVGALLSPQAAGNAARPPDVLMHVLLALVVVIVLARAIGSLFAYLQQPAVVGEIIAGILLGPSLLGRVSPAASAYLFSPTVVPMLGTLSEIGVVLYMFLVGLELDTTLLRRRGHAAVAISHASIVVPFICGTVLALYLYPRLSTQSATFTSFSLFLGVSMSVTAFPVLARILTDRKMHKSRMGAMTLTCAAVDDVTAWCLLAIVVSIVQAKSAGAIWTIAMALTFIAALLLVVRPIMVRLTSIYGNRGRLTQGVMAVLFVALLMSALFTDLIGIHAVFGAFALGAVIPHDSGMARDLTDRLEDLLVVLLLPAFFAYTGLRTQLSLVSGLSQWTMCGLIVVVASVGKFGGSALAARFTGLNWRDSSALGILMNTRGLVELIVLNIGLDLGVISPELFAMLVIMALVTTFSTTPILYLLISGESGREFEQVPATPPTAAPSVGQVAHRAIVAAISNPDTADSLIELAAAANPPEGAPLKVVTLVRRPQGGVRSGLREIEERVAPRVPVLHAVADKARALGVPVETQSAWTDDPAHDLVATARSAGAGWLMIGVHQPVFGTNEMGGTVRRVMDNLAGSSIHLGIVSRGHLHHATRVFALFNDLVDGRAALDLARRIARARNYSVHALLIADNGSEPPEQLTTLVREASRSSGQWLYTDVLRTRDSEAILGQVRGELLVAGAGIANQINLPINVVPERDGCIVVVHGAEAVPELPR